MRIIGIIVFALIAFNLQAQTYPSKPIRLVVPFAPGGSSSIVARTVAAEMEKGLGQSIVVDNKPGGGGNIAMHEVATSAPDGYTLIIGHVGSLAMNPFMYDKLPYDVDRDFAPVSLLAIVPAIFVVHESVPAKDLREFVALAKKDPGKLYYGSAGKLRVIAVGTAKRLLTLPEVGTVAEQGYPGFETSQWYGLNALAKTPEAIMRRLAAEAAKIKAD